MIDDSDSMSWQMLLDQIDTMWVESIWPLTDREKTERRCAQGGVEGGEARLETHGLTQTWLSLLQLTFALLGLKKFHKTSI